MRRAYVDVKTTLGRAKDAVEHHILKILRVTDKHEVIAFVSQTPG